MFKEMKRWLKLTVYDGINDPLMEGRDLGCPAFAEVFEEKLRTVEIFETSGYS
jgi:hypothetical protein